MKIIISLFIFYLLSITGYCQQTIQFADSIRNANHIPELSYAVINANQILEMAALGKHSVNLNDSASINDRFHIGSNTKALTAFMIAKFVEEGDLKWSTPFFDVYPEWKQTAKAGYLKITLLDLLSHRAKVQPFQGEGDTTIPSFEGTKQQKREAFGKFVLSLDPVTLDSTHQFIYSNAGYTLAALMLEKVMKKSWEQLVEKVFNQDLKMEVNFGWPENQSRKDTWGHSFENGSLTPVPSNTDYHLDYTEPAGDLNVKLENYIKFIQLNLNGLQGNNNYLKSESYQFIHNGLAYYSLGWFNVSDKGELFSTHSGTAGTYFSLVSINRTTNNAFIIFTNSFNDDTVNGVRFLMRKLKSEYNFH